MQNKFSPSEAATSFFSFFKAHPKFVLRIMFFTAIANFIAFLGLGIIGYFESISQILAFYQGGKQPSQEKVMAVFEQINWMAVVSIVLLGWVASIAILTMSLRKTVLNKEVGFYGLKVGRDEAHFLIAVLQLIGFFVAALFVVGIVTAIFDALGLKLVSILILLAFVALSAYAMGRVSMFGVFSVLNVEARVFASIKYTKEQIWSFIGAYALCAIMWLISTFIIEKILYLFLRAFMGENINGVPASLADFLSIGSMLFFALNSAAGGAFSLAMVCTGAYAYHKIAEGNSPTAPSVEAQ